jgi:hypothetical protein
MQHHKTPTNRIQSTLVVPSWRKQWAKQPECQSWQDLYHANKGTKDLGLNIFLHGHWVPKVNTKTDWQSVKQTQKNINWLEDTHPRRHCTDNHTDRHNYTTVHCYRLLPYIFYIGPLAQHLYQAARKLSMSFKKWTSSPFTAEQQQQPSWLTSSIHMSDDVMLTVVVEEEKKAEEGSNDGLQLPCSGDCGDFFWGREQALKSGGWCVR